MSLLVSLPADAVYKIFEFACVLLPVVCLVEKSVYSSHAEHADIDTYQGGFRTIIVGRMNSWFSLRYPMIKNVLSLPAIDSPCRYHTIPSTCRYAGFGCCGGVRKGLQHIAHLCAELSERGFNVSMLGERSGSIHYASMNGDSLTVTWSPDAGSEQIFRFDDLDQPGPQHFRGFFTIRPRGFYEQFRKLLRGDIVDQCGNSYMHVTTGNNPDSLLVWRVILVPSTLKLCSRFCFHYLGRMYRLHGHGLPELPRCPDDDPAI
jgi:hypothetical protein